MNRTLRWTRIPACTLFCLLVAAASARAQFELPGIGGAKNPKRTLGRDEIPAKVSAQVISKKADSTRREGTDASFELVISVDIEKGWHTYSLTQPKDAPALATTIQVDEIKGVTLGEFQADPPPKIHDTDQGTLEEHEGKVAWRAPLSFDSTVDPASLTISGTLKIQFCDESGCLPPKKLKFSAKVPVVGRFRSKGGHAEILGSVSPRVAAPGDKVQLTLTATPDDAPLGSPLGESYHVYELSREGAKGTGQPTLIVLTTPTGNAVEFRPDREPIPSADGLSYYEDAVTWTAEWTIPADAEAGAYAVGGLLGYQTCNSRGCDLPLGVSFSSEIEIGTKSIDKAQPLLFAASSYSVVLDATEGELPSETASAVRESDTALEGQVLTAMGLDPTKFQPDRGTTESRSLGPMLWFGFLGGLILNLMPCVLPVIGLKVLSFVEQGGQSRRRIFLLNFWYSVGILAVFLVLATLPVVLRSFGEQFGWGQQFSLDEVNVPLAAIVFAMALSFLGIWEIPIPGFAGSGGANKLAAQEGVAGAFFKGVLTTILATPCSGPFLGSALGYAFSQPAGITYAVFTAIGIGMASPYLAIGAFPVLIKFLPKPGVWMDTFKQLMGFVLLGTVVYLMTFIHLSRLVPTMMTLVGLWAGLWWIGRTPIYAELSEKLVAWGWGLAFSVVIAVAAFQWLGPITASRFERSIDAAVAERVSNPAPKVAKIHDANELEWRAFSAANFKEAQMGMLLKQ